jgi:hypothetical protein
MSWLSNKLHKSFKSTLVSAPRDPLKGSNPFVGDSGQSSDCRLTLFKLQLLRLDNLSHASDFI